MSTNRDESNVFGRIIGVAFLLCLIVGGAVFVQSRLNIIADEPPAGSVGVVVDVSPSVTPPCGALRRITEDALKSVHISKGSRLVLVTTGDRFSSYFPAPKIDETVPSLGRGPMGEGLEELFGKIADACAAFAPTESSPIFAAVKIALDQLRSRGCGPAAPCALVVITDMLETADAEVIRRIRTDAPRGPKANSLPPKTPALVPNEGVDVLICGFGSATAGTNYGIDVSPLKNAWSSLFTVSPRFQPFCEGTAQDATS
jgi:hypothetical protein